MEFHKLSNVDSVFSSKVFLNWLFFVYFILSISIILFSSVSIFVVAAPVDVLIPANSINLIC